MKRLFLSIAEAAMLVSGVIWYFQGDAERAMIGFVLAMYAYLFSERI